VALFNNIDQVKKIGVWVILCLVAIFFLTANIGGEKAWKPAEQIVLELFAPLQKMIQQAVQAIERVWLSYFNLVRVHDENLRLNRENNALKMENNRYRELLGTSRRLQELLAFKISNDWPKVVAQVIGRDPDRLFKAVLIDKGKNDGLKINMPVVNAEGVVGRLVSVSPNYSKVLLVIDQNSAVDCLIERSRESGIIKGLTDTVCRLDYFARIGDVVAGDFIVTSGLERIYPKGLPVGVVTEVLDVPGALFKEIKVQPVVNFSKLEELLIVLKEDPLLSQ
jgi:rod shape-determining protein MreC